MGKGETRKEIVGEEEEVEEKEKRNMREGAERRSGANSISSNGLGFEVIF